MYSSSRPFDHLAAGGIDDRKLLDLVAPELDAQGELLVAPARLRRNRRARGTCPAETRCRCARTGCRPACASTAVAIDLLAHRQPDHHRPVVFRRAQAVDARHAGHDDHVAAAHQGAGGGQPQAVDLLVDRGVLLDVDVALRDVGFGLVVVVIADEIVDGVVRKELLELACRAGRPASCCATGPASAAGWPG